MNPEKLFSLANSVALAGWLILAAAGRKRWASSLVCSAIIPLLLAATYVSLLVLHWGESAGGFSSLAGVATLFANKWVLLAGWVHYLCFDLFIGSWEVRDAQTNGISHWLVLPCLALTFLFGPAGLLLYLALRYTTIRSLLI